jgi:hypothetical protein
VGIPHGRSLNFLNFVNPALQFWDQKQSPRRAIA